LSEPVFLFFKRENIQKLSFSFKKGEWLRRVAKKKRAEAKKSLGNNWALERGGANGATGRRKFASRIFVFREKLARVDS